MNTNKGSELSAIYIRGVWLFVVLATWGILGNNLTFGQPRILNIQSLNPAAIAIGKPAIVEVVGTNNQDVEELLFSHSGIQAKPVFTDPLPGDTERVRRFGVFEVCVAPEVLPGIYEANAVGKYGVSNPKAIAILGADQNVIQLPSVAENQPLNLNEVVTGHLQPTTRSTFKIESHDEPRFIVCTSISVDSSLLPRIRVKNARGNTIKSARWRDRSPIIIGLPKGFSGQIELADEMYRGGINFSYMLGCFKSLEHPLRYMPEFFPVASVNALGLPETPVMDLRGGPEANTETIAITPPVELLLDRTANWKFRWVQSAGQINEVEYFSSGLGHSTDARINLFSVPSASNDPPTLLGAHEDTPVIGSNGVAFSGFDPRFTVAAPGEPSETHYLLEVDDLQSRSQIFDAFSNPARLRIAPPAPRFQCVAHWSPWTTNPATAGPIGSYLPAKGVAAIHVIASRLGGFGGAIEVNAKGLPEGITATTGIIQPNQNETFLFLQSSETGVDWTGVVQLFAKGTVHGESVEKPVFASTIHIASTPERGAPQSRLASRLLLKSSSQESAPVQVALTNNAIVEVHAGEKAAIPLTVTRSADNNVKGQLRPRYLPPGVACPEVEIAPEAKEISPEVTVAKECPPGEYSICFQLEMTCKLPASMVEHDRAVAYRDRLVIYRDAAETAEKKAELEGLITTANGQIEELAKAAVPQAVPLNFYTAPVQIKVLPPKG